MHDKLLALISYLLIRNALVNCYFDDTFLNNFMIILLIHNVFINDLVECAMCTKRSFEKRFTSWHTTTNKLL